MPGVVTGPLDVLSPWKMATVGLFGLSAAFFSDAERGTAARWRVQFSFICIGMFIGLGLLMLFDRLAGLNWAVASLVTLAAGALSYLPLGVRGPLKDALRPLWAWPGYSS